MTVELDGIALEVERIAGDPARPAIVLLHEGLGSVSAWGDFPAALGAATGCGIVAYSRAGYGRSSVVRAPFGVDYMHREAEHVLPALLDRLALERPVLFGHSDGASIALLFAASRPGRAAALVVEAPHAFVEPLTVASIAQIAAGYPRADGLRRSLARHHADPDLTFRRWSDIWLDPAFRAWDIRNTLAGVAAPTLVLQGREDEYGTFAQVEAIAARAARVDVSLFGNCRHAPHRDARDAVLARTAVFVSHVAV